jgi:hypothetical protein
VTASDRKGPQLLAKSGPARSRSTQPEDCGGMEVGQKVRALRSLDLGDAGKVEKGAIGVLESMNNGPYMPYLVTFPSGTFAFEEGEIEEAEA